MADENMELDERKVKILDAVIRNYLATGEPVGSRTISKYTDLNLSSATIRNEMADLEELGYIVQPHTSAGRIPSDKGYRFYVDHLMQEKDREVKEMKDFVIEKTQKMDEVLKKVAKMLANNTNYATIVSAPTYSGNKVKFMQLSNVDEKHILAVNEQQHGKESDDRRGRTARQRNFTETEHSAEYSIEWAVTAGNQSGNDFQTERAGRRAQ